MQKVASQLSGEQKHHRHCDKIPGAIESSCRLALKCSSNNPYNALEKFPVLFSEELVGIGEHTKLKSWPLRRPSTATHPLCGNSTAIGEKS